MPVNRRSFLKSGATSVLTTVIALSQFTPAHGQDKPKSDSRIAPTPRTDEPLPLPFKAEQSPLFFFRAETFRPYVGGIFVARAGANSIQMTLTGVRDCSPKPTTKITTGKAPRTECFALEFSSDKSLSDLTSIYDIEHAALGQFPLFLTQRDGANGKSLYEAVFNRLL
jgi:hypothetical protein